MGHRRRTPLTSSATRLVEQFSARWDQSAPPFRRVAELERALSDALLTRSPRGIALTEAGRLALARGTRIETDLRTLARGLQAAQSGQVSGTLRVVANTSAIVGFLPGRLKAFRAVCACLDDRADIGIGVALAAPAGIETWPFATDPLIVVLPRAHLLASRQALPFSDIMACRTDAPIVVWDGDARVGVITKTVLLRGIQGREAEAA